MIKQHQSGVSPIVSVVLMIVTAVLLASVVTGYANNLVQDLLTQPVQAGIDIDEQYDASQDSYNVTIVWSQEGTVNSMYAIDPSDGTQTPRLESVGQKIELSGVDDESTVRVVGVLDDGTTGVIRQYQVG